MKQLVYSSPAITMDELHAPVENVAKIIRQMRGDFNSSYFILTMNNFYECDCFFSRH
jgi:hypothetical protein